jgi:hypothetical protein
VAAGELGRGFASGEGRAVTSAELHERTLSIETRPLDDDRLGVHAELRDVRHVEMPAYLGVSRPAGVVHHMALDVELDRALTIFSIDAVMHAIPYEPSKKTRGEGCRSILPNYQWLIGTTLDGGYARRVMETVGGHLGCFHILSLAQCLPLAVRAASGRLCGAALHMPEGSREVVRDSCAEWRAESPNWRSVRETTGSGFRPFRREIRIAARADEQLRLWMTASLRDVGSESPAASAELRFALEIPTFTILEARAELIGAPFAGCRALLASAQRLAGLSVAKGFTSAALERIAGPAGCAHLAALVIALTPTIPQASGALAGFLKLRPDQKLRGGTNNAQVGSCHMWRADGPLVSVERSPNRGESV